MKRAFRIVLLFVALMSLASLAFAPLPGVRGDVPGEIGIDQAAIMGVVASVVVFIFNLYAKYQNKKVPREVLTVLVYAISVALAWLWSAPALPSLPTGSGPSELGQAYVTFALALLNQGALVLGFATLIYNWLLKKVDEKYFGPVTETIE